MGARHSKSFFAVLGCFFLALLHLSSQSAHLSIAPTFSRVTMHGPILPQPSAQLGSLLPDPISMKDLQMLASEEKVPSSTHELVSTEVTIAKKPEEEPPHEEFEASNVDKVEVSSLTSMLPAGSEDVNGRGITPSLEGAIVIDNQTVNHDEVLISNAGQSKNFPGQLVTTLGQASNQNLSQKMRVQEEGIQTKKEKDQKPATDITELREEPKQAEIRMPELTPSSPSAKMLDVEDLENKEVKDKKDDELVSEPKENEAIEKLDDVIKEPIDPKEHASPQPSINSTAKERLDWLKVNWDKIKIFDDRDAKEFSSRMNNFLTANSPGLGACNLRFFMIWIAPLRAFGSREKLAVESVFKSHPSACLVILSPTLDSSQGRLILDPLSSRGFKILIITPHIPFLVKSTPAEKWFKDLKDGLIDPGTISLNQNLSNLLRLVVLYKYGGIYIDNDIIIMKSFAKFNNVIGAQNINRETGKWNRLNNAVMVFEKQSPLLLRIMEGFYLTFNGSKWGHNGPYLVSRVVTKEGEWGCKVLDPLAFYPVDWDHIGGFFQAPRNSVDKEWVGAKIAQLSQHTFAIHLWNKFSRDMELEPGSIMDSIFRRFCIVCDLQYAEPDVVLNDVNTQ